MGRRASELSLAALVAVAAVACRPSSAGSIPQARANEENRRGADDLAAGALSDAEQWFHSALARSQRIDDAPGQAVALLNLSRVDTERWALDRATSRATQALALTGDDLQLRGAAVVRLATIQSLRGKHALAIDHARQAQHLVGQAGGRRKARARARLRGDRRTTIAYTLIRAGGEHCVEAHTRLDDAIRAYGRRAGPTAQAAIAHLKGQLALGEGDLAAARSAFARALAIDQQRGAPLDVAADLEALATAAQRSDDVGRAQDWLRRALAVREAMDNPRRALAVADRLDALGESAGEANGTRAQHRAELGDIKASPPAPANPCV